VSHRQYAAPSFPDPQALNDALRRDDTHALQSMVIGVAMLHEDADYAQDLCNRLSTHSDEGVRGNAVLGLGHIARRFRHLYPPLIDVIAAALNDPSEYVRGHASSAADDVFVFLGLSSQLTGDDAGALPMATRHGLRRHFSPAVRRIFGIE
jgi:hypothetical protein